VYILVNKSFQTLRSKLAAPITDVPEILKQSYLPGLDGLRAMSVLFYEDLRAVTFISYWFTGQ